MAFRLVFTLPMTIVSGVLRCLSSPMTRIWCLTAMLLSGMIRAGAILPTVESLKLQQRRSSHYHSETNLRPRFVEDLKDVVVVPSDDLAYLHCKIENLGDHEVAWVRQSDGTVLTINEKAFTSDGRIQLSYKESENDYILWIKDVKKSDSGVYECQLSTDPPQSFFVDLRVIEYEAKLSGSSNVAARGTIWLRCEIKVAEANPNGLTIRWYHNNSLIIPNVPEKFRMIPSKYEEQNSVLVGGIDILHADAKDAGEYSCRTPGAKQSLAVVVTGVTDVPSEGRSNRKSNDESASQAAMVKSGGLESTSTAALPVLTLLASVSLAALC